MKLNKRLIVALIIFAGCTPPFDDSDEYPSYNKNDSIFFKQIEYKLKTQQELDSLKYE